MNYRLAATFFIALTMVFFRLPHAEAVAANRIIWDTPQIIPDSFVVPADTTLIIKSGVTITTTNPDGANLEILGNIVTSEGDPILFNNINITIQSSSIELSHIINSELHGSINIEQGKVEITKNKIISPDIGIAIYQSDNIIISQNDIQATESAITVEQSENIEITKNNIHTSDIGILVGEGTSGNLEFNTLTGNGIGVQINTQDTLTFSKNNIYQNNLTRLFPDDLDRNFGVKVINYSGLLNAAKNWWGCPTGPLLERLDDNVCEVISENIDFQSWLEAQAVYHLENSDLIIHEIMTNPSSGSKGEWLSTQNRNVRF
ncbi:MAG: NosD domain-containing protein [bacterium]|nr:NosD domain-containing protein [bacterium]